MQDLPLTVRLGIAAAATLVGLALVEIGLRIAYSSLPSIAALDGTDYQLEALVAPDVGGESTLCDEVSTFLSHRTRWGPKLVSGGGGSPPPPPGAALNGGPGRPFPNLPGQADTVAVRQLTFGVGAPARTLWLVGDSVTYGQGVEPEQTFGAVLARRLSQYVGESVESRNLGIPGAGYCTAFRRLESELQAAAPDLVLFTVYADDLEERSLLVVDGALVASPDRARPRELRWLVSNSYAANLAWYRLVGLVPPNAPAGRTVSSEDVAAFGRAAAEMYRRVTAAGGTPLFILLPAPSEASCTTTDSQARCHWLADDLQRMAGALDTQGIHYLDLRGSWPTGRGFLQDDEAAAVDEGGVAMHPNAGGHQFVADEIWAGLLGPELGIGPLPLVQRGP